MPRFLVILLVCLFALCGTGNRVEAKTSAGQKTASGDFFNLPPDRAWQIELQNAGSHQVAQVASTGSASGRRHFLSPDPFGHGASMSLYDFANGDPVNGFDPDGRFGKGVFNAGKDLATGAGSLLYNTGGTVAYGYLSMIDAQLADEIYGAQAHALGQAAIGAGNLVYSTGGFLAYAGTNLVDGAYADSVYGAQAEDFYQIVSSLSGGEDNSAAYRLGYTAANIGTLFVGGETGAVRRSGKGVTTAENTAIRSSGSAIESADAMSIRFTQPTVSQNFSTGQTLTETANALRNGEIAAVDLPTIRVVEQNGNLYTLDNRRLVAFQQAGLTEIPIQIVSLSDPAIMKEFLRKFNPVNGGQNIVVTPNAAGRGTAETVLQQYGKIK